VSKRGHKGHFHKQSLVFNAKTKRQDFITEMAASAKPQPMPRILPASEVVPTMRQMLQEQVAVFDHITKTVSPLEATFANVIKPLINIENEIQGRIAVIAMLRYASPDPAAREASDEAIMYMREAGSGITAKKEVYLLVKAVKDKSEQLSVEDAKYLDSLMQEFKRSGHGRLDDEHVRIYLDRRNRIDDLRRQYNRNIRNNKEGLWFSLEELDGVPVHDLARFATANADQVGDSDRRFVRFTRADINAVLQYAKLHMTRKKMYVANEQKLPENVDLFREILLLRDENARLLGYANHADFRLENRVAKTAPWVDGFLDDIERVLLPRGKKEMQRLLEKRRLDFPQDEADSMPPWDYDYYSRIVMEDLNVQHDLIAEYFPLEETVSSMLDIFSSCLQLQFKPVPPDSPWYSTWHEDVKVWSVWDTRDATKGDFIGYLYADLLSRPNKHQGSQNVNLQCGYVKGGIRIRPATVLMCSFPRPAAASRCTLLRHSEMTSLFHELGHAMHDLVSKTASVRFHGHRMPPDVFEVPSVMLENWCWTKGELRQMSRHFTTLKPEYLIEWKRQNPEKQPPPATMPDKLIEPLKKSRDANRASVLLRQL
jgi:metallopeptidase MepB